MPQAAQVVLDKIKTLTSSPTNAQYILVADDYGRGNTAASGEAYKNQIFAGLAALRKANPSVAYAYVDFKYIWSGVLGASPGYKAFGYTSAGACTVDSSTTAGACSDPAHTFYWIPGCVPSSVAAIFFFCVPPGRSMESTVADDGWYCVGIRRSRRTVSWPTTRSRYY